jgi:predicted methyltransferase
MLNNASFARWSDGDWQKHIASNRLPNVENRIVDLADMKLGAGTADAIFVIKVYHDLYWVDKDPKNWPKVDVPKTLDQLAKALKPGGTLLVVDHSAKEGSASNDAGSLHRIEEAYAKKDWESHGLKLVAHSDLLRRPDDKRDLVSYQGPATGKTDRFVLVFKKI